QHLPDFKPQLADGSTPTINVRQLLTHTSGLGYGFTESLDGPYHRAGVSDGLDVPGRSFADNAKRLASVPLRAAPGSAFHYSLSIDVLGEVVARAGGASLPELVTLLVTQPLHMTDTAFRVVDPARLVTAYANADNGPILINDGQLVPLGGSAVTFAPSRIKDPASYPSGGAGMAGTAGDFLTFLEALRTNSVGLRAETLEALAHDQLGAADSSELGSGVRFGYASSILVDPARAKSVANPGTLRWGGAYGHSWWIDREAKLSIVLLTNTTFEGMVGQITRDVEHAVYGR
ncbi:MAG: serine hydrolase domain-containing protein, partial [Polyangiales bacterium]